MTGFEYQGFEEARAIARRRHQRVLLPVAVVLVILLALVCIAVYDYKTMRADALALSKGVITNLQSRIETEVSAYLEPIPGIIRLSRDLIADQLPQGIPSQLTESLGLGLLDNAPQLASIYVGDSNGEFLMVRRYSAGQQSGLETKFIRRSAADNQQLEILLTRRDESNTIVSQEVTDWDQYDPRARPWFRGANQARELFWTDVYPFFTAQTAGITGAVPLFDSEDQPRAVVGADVTLASISNFLGSLSIGKTGQALIVDEQGRLIAHPSVQLLQRGDDGEFRLAHIADLNDPIINRAFDRYQVEGHGRRDFILDGRRYISSASSLGQLVQRDWSVLLVVPEDDFVGFVVDNVSKTLAMGLAVIALAAILAGLLIRQGLLADRDAIRILEREAQLDAEGQAFGELAANADGLHNDQEAIALVTEAVVRAARSKRGSIWLLNHDRTELSCIDCFDRSTDGHTAGALLQRHNHDQAFEQLITNNKPQVTVNANAEHALSSLARQYLTPMGCQALVSAPIRLNGECIGLLWLEDGSSRDEWPPHTINFVQAIANLLAIRYQPDRAQISTLSSVGNTTRSIQQPVSTNLSPADQSDTNSITGFTQQDADTSLDSKRAAAFCARIADRNNNEVIEQLAVLSMRFTDAGALAGQTEDAEEMTMARILADLEKAASHNDVGYLKFFNDQLIASIDPADHSDNGLSQLVHFALDSKAICERHLARQQSPLSFRIGIDIGPVVGGQVGSKNRNFTFWGEAVQTAAQMADTSLPGAIQVTQPVYLQLQHNFLFQQRGHHYLEGVGEFSTYLLSGHL